MPNYTKHKDLKNLVLPEDGLGFFHIQGILFHACCVLFTLNKKETQHNIDAN